MKVNKFLKMVLEDLEEDGEFFTEFNLLTLSKLKEYEPQKYLVYLYDRYVYSADEKYYHFQHKYSNSEYTNYVEHLIYKLEDDDFLYVEYVIPS